MMNRTAKPSSTGVIAANHIHAAICDFMPTTLSDGRDNGNGALVAGGDHFVGFWTLRVFSIG